MFVLDYGQRTVGDAMIAGIQLMAAEIYKPQYAATGEARAWANTAMTDVEHALDRYENETIDEEQLYWEVSDIWDIGAECLYQATGLHAHEDSYAGGLMFVTDDELAEINN